MRTLHYQKYFNDLSYSVEKGFRLMGSGIEHFNFFMLQFKIDKSTLVNNDLKLSIYNSEYTFEKTIIVDKVNKRLITPTSHEDPLVSDETNYYICLQLPESEIINFGDDKFTAMIVNGNNVILKEEGDRLLEKSKNYKSSHFSELKGMTVLTHRDSVLTLHLGDKFGKYTETEMVANAGTTFDFTNFINNYEYIGIQFSYTNLIPEVEEKYIIVGQKGIFISGKISLGDSEPLEIQNPILFDSKYQRELKQDELIIVDTINEFLKYYENKAPKIFEFSYEKILEGYKTRITYNQDGLYSKKNYNGNQKHYNLTICKECSKKTECLISVPSGLSKELFRVNSQLEKAEDCSVYQVLRKNY